MIKILQPDAWQIWRKIRLEAVAQSPESFGGAWEEEVLLPDAKFKRRLQNSTIFAKIDGGEAVGTVGYYVNSGLKLRHRGTLFGLYVRPDRRGEGVARKLLEAALEHAQDKIERMQLSVVTTNKAARRLYESLGFTVYGEDKRALRVHDTYHDELLMIKTWHKEE